MKVKLICVGKTINNYLIEGEKEYIQRLNHYNSVEKIEIPEIENAKKGKPAFIQLKLNSLVDNDLIVKLYKASNAGVKIKLIVRGICCLVPGVKGYSENIQAISILDKFLEHTRIFIFGNDDQPKYYNAFHLEVQEVTQGNSELKASPSCKYQRASGPILC